MLPIDCTQTRYFAFFFTYPWFETRAVGSCAE